MPANAPTRSTARRFACARPSSSRTPPETRWRASKSAKLSIRDKIAIERDGDTVATVHKALVGIRDRFSIDLEDGDDMKAHGNVVDHEYEIERDGDTVATISKKWFRVRESYGVDVAADADIPLILAVTVAIDSLTSPD